jgi:hypothetical protein
MLQFFKVTFFFSFSINLCFTPKGSVKSNGIILKNRLVNSVYGPALFVWLVLFVHRQLTSTQLSMVSGCCKNALGRPSTSSGT